MAETPRSLKRKISPPPLRKPSNTDSIYNDSCNVPTPAAVEAGQAEVTDHLDYFCKQLSSHQRPPIDGERRLSMSAFRTLYKNNEHPRGRHFVIHQHDHPVAGAFYIMFNRQPSWIQAHA